MSTESDAKVGKLYKDLCRAKRRLEQRKSEADQMVETLHMLAECFDESVEENRITGICGNQFRCTRTELNNRVGGTPLIDFPTNAGEIAAEIYWLENEIKQLKEDLDLETRHL